MNTNSNQPHWIRRLLRWTFSWQGLRCGFLVLVSIVTLFALFIAEENWRGRRAWETHQRDWEAKGEKFDLAALIPPRVPEEQNFATTPLLKPLFDYQPGTLGQSPGFLAAQKRAEAVTVRTEAATLSVPSPQSWANRKATDLKAWQRYYSSDPSFPAATPVPAQDVLLALSKFKAELSEITAASQRPYSRFSIHYEESFAALLPHLSALRNIARVFSLRASAQLEAGNPEAAFGDVQTCFRLANTIKAEPLLISHLVRVALLNLAMQPLWEGLSQHRWTDAQLREFQERLGTTDVLADWQRAMRGERCLSLGAIDQFYMKGQPLVSLEELGDHSGLPFAVLKLFRGFWYQNMLSVSRFHLEHVLPTVDVNARRVNVPAVHQTEQLVLLIDKQWGYYGIFAKLLVPAITGSVQRSAQTQTSCDQARVACALERFWLAHDKFPKTLDALLPQFIEQLPRDVITGEALKYHQTEDGQFILYSVGWNEKDDGGLVALTTEKKPRADHEQGDWVWRYPVK